MNWLLIFIIWGRHSETVTQTQFQTKFLCEKAAKELNYINQAPEREIPVGGYTKCVQIHKVEKVYKPAETPACTNEVCPLPAPAPESMNEEPETSNG